MNQINLEKVRIDTVGFFRYKWLTDRYLLTNDAGECLFLGEKEFKDFIEGRLDQPSLVHNNLSRKNFVRSTLDKDELVLKHRDKSAYLRGGTSLHIVIPTLRCNHRCLYCQASARSPKQKKFDMNLKTARKVVDAIFEAPRRNITIEFQGGEPLLNWDAIEYIIDRSEKKNRRAKKTVRIVLVSNLTLMTKKRYRYLCKHNVGICTSLDGPQFIHDKNRPMVNGKSGYDVTTKWLRHISLVGERPPGALVTLSRYSLDYPKEIIHEYLKWGIHAIPLRPVSTLGYAGHRRNELGITAGQFLTFYRQALEYLIELCEITGEQVFERMAKVCLQKIFNPRDPGYLDLRSPCGAGCGQLAYQYDGSVYTCDEGRMLSDDAFKLGNVHTHAYQELMESKQMKTAVMASCTDGLYCDYCVYKPYCGVCPVVNWQECGSIYAQPKRSFTCKVNEGMFDIIFELLKDKRKSKVLLSWIGKGNRPRRDL